MTGADADAYGGVLGAFPYAFRRSDSRLFRAYVVLGGLLAALLAAFFGLALVVSVAATAGVGGGTVTFVRSIYVVVGVVLVAPVVAPVLFVARHHRRGRADPGYDAALAAGGVVYVATLYAGAIASMPPEFTIDGRTATRPTPTGPIAPVVEALYAVPESLSWLVPVAGALVVYLLHRRLR